MLAFAKCSCSSLKLSHLNTLCRNPIIKETKAKSSQRLKKHIDITLRGNAMQAGSPMPSPSKLLC